MGSINGKGVEWGQKGPGGQMGSEKGSGSNRVQEGSGVKWGKKRGSASNGVKKGSGVKKGAIFHTFAPLKVLHLHNLRSICSLFICHTGHQ